MTKEEITTKVLNDAHAEIARLNVLLKKLQVEILKAEANYDELNYIKYYTGEENV